jgi:hypothetical protein
MSIFRYCPSFLEGATGNEKELYSGYPETYRVSEGEA